MNMHVSGKNHRRLLSFAWLILTLGSHHGLAMSDKECSDVNYENCTNNLPPACVAYWWRKMEEDKPVALVGAALLVFFATFLPKIIVRLVVFSLTKIKFIRLVMLDLEKYCFKTTRYLVSATLVWLALIISELRPFFCKGLLYIWGIFFLMWIYSLFHVLQNFALRRFGGLTDNFSKQVVLVESVKLLRLMTLIIIATIIYLQIFGEYQDILMYSIFGTVGLTMALGSVAAAHNALGGLYLVFHAPFKVDDFIEIGHVKGTVQRVALRYTELATLDGTTTYVPNNFFLCKPMVNFSQRPKRQLEIFIELVSTTPVERIRQFLKETETMLQTLHTGLTSHQLSAVDFKDGNATEPKRFFFVTMDELYKVRIYSFTEELDPKKHAMIKSEVWLAVAEIMEDLEIEEKVSRTKPDQRLPFIEDEASYSLEFDLFNGQK